MSSEEKVLLRRKANVRSGRLRATGTFILTDRKISFHYRAGRRIDISVESIKGLETRGVIFKKMTVSTDEREYVVYLKGVENVVGLLNALRNKR